MTTTNIATVEATIAFHRVEAAREACRRNPTAANISALQGAWDAWARLIGLPLSGEIGRAPFLRLTGPMLDAERRLSGPASLGNGDP